MKTIEQLKDLSTYEIEALLKNAKGNEKVQLEEFLCGRMARLNTFTDSFLSCNLMNLARTQLIRKGRAQRVMTGAGEMMHLPSMVELIDTMAVIRNAMANHQKQKGNGAKHDQSFTEED